MTRAKDVSITANPIPNFLVYVSVNTTAANDATIPYDVKVYDDLNNTITISVDTSIIANRDYVDNADELSIEVLYILYII
jgi:hypothetical protein